MLPRLNLPYREHRTSRMVVNQSHSTVYGSRKGNPLKRWLDETRKQEPWKPNEVLGYAYSKDRRLKASPTKKSRPLTLLPAEQKYHELGLVLAPENGGSTGLSALHEMQPGDISIGSGLNVYLVSASQVWVFPETDITSFLKYLTRAGVIIAGDVPVHTGIGASNSSSSSQKSLPRSANSFQSSRRSRNRQKGNARYPEKSNPLMLDIAKQPHDKRKVYYSCPFVKRNPEHYLRISNACTKPPGFYEIKRVK
jgi:hypothetical protein